ncbi:3-oxoacyl-synthase II [Rhizoclosmatium globosum]|uniref:3-oxoacyl-[acyl-carrier-protein] synthase n=1 Tax=Rhizoclosmatium globosum TaxID=329046 RepID=A0A1Y2BKB8_9FUNG|nr:3-oxoacyl-synthase II [Rhizoclosmatium globosum]|eukprot:ORY35211.1 3-oxoacyl-synthase II [Rhizoclosmatium globosum]
MRRVVVTGLGAVTPLGNTISQSWQALIGGKCGIGSLSDEAFAGLPSRVAGQVKGFDHKSHVPKTDLTKTTPFMHFAYAAAHQALEDANWFPEDVKLKQRTGVCIGSGIGCLDEIAETARSFHEKGYKKVSPYFVPKTLVNMAAGNISIRYNFMGPNHAVSTACATGAHAIGDASRFIQHGDADVILAGGTESSITPLSLAGFCRAKSLATKYNDTPERSCRPFDAGRDGFVMGEGAGIVVLEEREHALARGARIYAELKGYGLTGDGFHITSPPDDGDGAGRAMLRALETGGMKPSDVDYVNAHATSTEQGDLAETRAIKRVFGEHRVAVSSTKGATGHLLGAAGSVEAIFAILSVYHDIVPHTLNLETLAEEFTLNYIRGEAQRGKAVRAALSNSFGFGGTNASLLFAKA